MEQLVRDARIAQIYEGANGIHALDLVGRKLPMHGGRPIKRYLERLAGFLAAHRADPAMAEFTAPLERALRSISRRPLCGFGMRRPATRRRSGRRPTTTCASWDSPRWVTCGRARPRVALDRVNGDNSGFYEAKLATARFFMKRLLPATGSLKRTLSAGADALMTMDAEAF